MSNQIPRRAYLDKLTPEELGLYDMLGAIEKLGAHPLLTDVVVLLGEARNKLADWVELQPAHFVGRPTRRALDLPYYCAGCGSRLNRGHTPECPYRESASQ